MLQEEWEACVAHAVGQRDFGGKSQKLFLENNKKSVTQLAGLVSTEELVLKLQRWERQTVLNRNQYEGMVWFVQQIR